MKKTVLCGLVALLALSCSTPITNNFNAVKNNFTDLEKKYKSFSTKALSDAYVSRMFTKFLNTSPNPTQVIRQLEFARYLQNVKSDPSYFNSLKNIIATDNSIYTKIAATSGVPEKRSAEPATFGVFVESLNPNPISIISLGLVLNFDAGNIASYPGSGTIWSDLSGNSNSGTLHNGVSYNSANSGSLVFDGIDNYVTFANNSNFAFGTGAFTIEFWISAPLNIDKFILGGRNSVGTMHITTGGDIGYGNSTPGCLRYVGSSTITTGSTLINDGTWKQCTIVRDGSNNITLYINGVSIATGTDTTNYSTINTSNWNIGKNDISNNNFLNGKLSSFHIYKGKGLSSAEVTQNFNSLRSRFGI